MQLAITQCRDWNAAWQTALARSRFFRNDKDFWNRRADTFAAHASHKSDYPQQFLNIVRPHSSSRVLDIGCGPGTIAIPMAPMVRQITALDFSERMLAILAERCAQEDIGHIHPVAADWDDDWGNMGITRHDLVIASRSFVPPDLEKAIDKLNRFTTRRVCISATVGDGPFDPRIMKAAGRNFTPCPDYIYILNQLHQMGIYARVDFTYHPVNRTYADPADAVDECRWMIPDMTSEEKNRLERFFASHLILGNNCWYLPDTPPVRWAVICWDISPEGTSERHTYENEYATGTTV